MDCDNSKWYAINTNPRCEDIVCHVLGQESFEVFLPKVCKKSNKSAEEPLFPGYLFARLNLTLTNWVKIKYLHGVRKILSYGNTPIPVSEKIIASIKQNIRGQDYFKKALSLKAGEKVRFLKGPFEGLEGIFTGEVSGKDRVKVLLEAIERWAFSVEVDASELSKVG